MRQTARRDPLDGRAAPEGALLSEVTSALPPLRDRLQFLFQTGQDAITYEPLHAACRTALGEAYERGLILRGIRRPALDQRSTLLASLVIFRYIARKRPRRVSSEMDSRRYFLIDVLQTLDELLEAGIAAAGGLAGVFVTSLPGCAETDTAR